MTIPPQFLDELRMRLPLSDVIGKRIKITRAGREFKACCPFHKEKTPSFTINDDKQFYHCFGCGAHGDVIGFVMEYDNMSFMDAVEMLSAAAGLSMPKPDPEAAQKAQKKKDLYGLTDIAAEWFQDQLMVRANREVLNYLQKRGLDTGTLSEFRVGYAPGDRQALRAYLKGEGYTDEDMIEAGLVKKSDTGRAPYVFFRDRIMFPVSDRRGRIVAFGGRILPDHMRPPDQGDYTPAKYINTPDTVLFDKGRILYGAFQARQAAREGKSVIVAEGYMDVIAAHQAGYKGAVAPMGTALTPDQIQSLWMMIPAAEKVPVLCFDGDEAGRRAAARSYERILPLLKPGQSARFAFLPEGEDPDSLIRAHGGAAFRKVIDAAIPLFEFIWQSHTAGKSFETPEARAGVVKALEEDVRNIADRDVQKHYKSLLHERIGETFFKRQRGGGAGKTYQRRMQNYKIRRPAFKTGILQEKILLAALLNHPHIYEALEEVLGQFNFTGPDFSHIKQEIILALDETPALDREGLQNHLKQKGLTEEIDGILNESVYVHASFVRPGADENHIYAQLKTWLKGIKTSNGKEIRARWKDAFQAADEDEEEKLKNMVMMTAHEET